MLHVRLSRSLWSEREGRPQKASLPFLLSLLRSTASRKFRVAPPPSAKRKVRTRTSPSPSGRNTVLQALRVPGREQKTRRPVSRGQLSLFLLPVAAKRPVRAEILDILFRTLGRVRKVGNIGSVKEVPVNLGEIHRVESLFPGAAPRSSLRSWDSWACPSRRFGPWARALFV